MEKFEESLGDSDFGEFKSLNQKEKKEKDSPVIESKIKKMKSADDDLFDFEHQLFEPKAKKTLSKDKKHTKSKKLKNKK